MKDKVFRSEAEWQKLFAAHQISGLSAAAFCRERGLCPKHFSLRKKQLGEKVDAGFSELKVSRQPKTASPRTRVKTESVGLGCRLRIVELELSDLSRESLCDVVSSLLR